VPPLPELLPGKRFSLLPGKRETLARPPHQKRKDAGSVWRGPSDPASFQGFALLLAAQSPETTRENEKALEEKEET
jgi:hypothetical protein